MSKEIETQELIDFARNRVDEDMNAALGTIESTTARDWSGEVEHEPDVNWRGVQVYDGQYKIAAGGRRNYRIATPVALHILRQQPNRVIKECDAKNLILDELESEFNESTYHLAKYIASVYSDHEDYKKEWEL
jgi:hypothetical protein